MILLKLLNYLNLRKVKNPKIDIGGLDDSAFDAIGKTLSVNPHYGWGWSREGSKDLHPTVDLDFVLDELWEFEGTRRGGIGHIITNNHPLSGNYIVFSTRHVGHWNFTNKVGIYNICTGRGKPTKNEKGWPMLHDVVIAQGFGEIKLKR